MNKLWHPLAGWSRNAVLLLVTLGSLTASKATAAQNRDASDSPLVDRVIDYRLDNGWRFLLLPIQGAPTISFETFVATGSMHDPEALEGLTHHVKNLLFKGSARLGTKDWEQEQKALTEVDEAHATWRTLDEKGDLQGLANAKRLFESARERASQWVISEEYSRVLEHAGGGPSLNAFTDEDSTRFVVSLPSNQLETWCWMESERFRAPVFREFYSERDALLEDRRGRVETDPLGLLSLELRATAYGAHPLGRSSLGSPESIARLDRPAAEAFFRGRFGASQLTTTIVGNFDSALLIPRLDLYFSSVPSGPRELPAEDPIPGQEGERRVRVLSSGRPVLAMAWHGPPRAHDDFLAVEIAVRLLGYARSSRLERRLVRENAWVSELALNPAWGADRLGSLIFLRAIPNLGIDIDTVETAIGEEIAELAKNGPGEEELAGVKRVATAEHLRGLRDQAAIAAGMAQAAVETGDWRNYFSMGRRIAAISPEDVQRVLRTWFTADRLSVAVLEQARDE